MNARELLAALDAVPGVRAVRVNGGLEEGRLVGGVEVAWTADADERRLRRSWRERFGGGPDPLLVLADDPDTDGAVRALGPVSAGAPVRLVTAADLLTVLEQLPAQPGLKAVRHLAQELDRLDRSGVPGLAVHGLGTMHLYTVRVRQSPLWDSLAEAAQGVTGEWKEILTGLGYELERQPVRNWLARRDGRTIAVVRPLADPAAFTKLDADGRPPEGMLIEDCVRANARYGVLVAGSRLRLFDADPVAGSAVARSLELDAATLSDDDRPLLGLLAPSMLAAGGFAELMADARSFGVGLRERVDRAIRADVLPGLGAGLGRWARDGSVALDDDAERGELEAAALTLVFRALFLLYAESSGYLPVAHEAYRPYSLSQLVQDAAAQREKADRRSTALWDRWALLVRAMRTGNRSWGVPAYNGALFAPDGFAGAGVLERASLTDAELAPVIAALGIDPETEAGVDFSGLDVGHLGHVYEGLLSLRLSVADRDFVYDARKDCYVAAEAAEAEVRQGELLWLTDEGGRKGGGVYYTPEALVRHLVRRGVVPAFERHLDQVEALVASDPAAAAQRLFAFRVLDPACGSAHFLVAVVDELADLVARFLGRHPLPGVRRAMDDLRAGAGETLGVGIEDVALLRRLVLKRCVYGVDRSAMGAEVAKVSLWLASFVPGLALSYLDHNVRVGDSLVGVAALAQLQRPGAEGQLDLAVEAAREAVQAGAEAAAALLLVPDRTPDEVAASGAADREARSAAAGARRLLDLWVADPLGVDGARELLWTAPGSVLEAEPPDLVARAGEVARENHALHWPLAFPEVFAAGGFDAVVGNPPWEEVTVEELAFYARYQPGLRSLGQRAREEQMSRLRERRPELVERFAAEQERTARQRGFFAADTGYATSGGDPDLYKLFCQRYGHLLAGGGVLAVVLPRSAFLVKGSRDFRRWLLDETLVERVDFLLNKGRWMFDTHPQYTVALLVSRVDEPGMGDTVEVSGVAASADAFAAQSAVAGRRLARPGLGPDGEVPLLPSQEAADLLPRLVGAGTRFALGGGRWRCFPVAEFHETADKKLWDGATEGRELWKGESFDRYDPRGQEVRPCPATERALAKQRKPRPGGESLLAAELSAAERAAAVVAEVAGPRVVFRDVTNRTNARTVIAALVPQEVFLVNSAPYLAFADDRDRDRAACLGVLNSVPFDWLARRYVEMHVNYFILELLTVPRLDDTAYAAIAEAAARLSCPDDRFADFAASVGVEHGPLPPEERRRLEVDIDAHVCRAYGLTPGDLPVLFADFSEDGVSAEHRELLTERLAEL